MTRIPLSGPDFVTACHKLLIRRFSAARILGDLGGLNFHALGTGNDGDVEGIRVGVVEAELVDWEVVSGAGAVEVSGAGAAGGNGEVGRKRRVVVLDDSSCGVSKCVVDLDSRQGGPAAVRESDLEMVRHGFAGAGVDVVLDEDADNMETVTNRIVANRIGGDGEDGARTRGRVVTGCSTGRRARVGRAGSTARSEQQGTGDADGSYRDAVAVGVCGVHEVAPSCIVG